MKNFDRLLKLAGIFQYKYAIQSLQEAVQNAASWGPQTHGIMNFPEQLKKDQATLSLTVSKSGKEFTVSQPVVNPSTVAQNYAALPGQIKKYLEKYYGDEPDQQVTFSYGEPAVVAGT